MGIKNLLKKIVYRIRGHYTVEALIDMGLTVGKNFNPQLGVNLDPSHCWLITIGDDVTIAPGAQILAHDASTCQALGHAKIACVTIGNRVFIGAGSIILSGVTIGDNVIVGAGSVVTHSLEANKVYAGNPAREICSMDEFVKKHQEQMARRPVYDESYTLRKGITAEKKQEQKEALMSGGGYVV